VVAASGAGDRRRWFAPQASDPIEVGEQVPRRDSAANGVRPTHQSVKLTNLARHRAAVRALRNSGIPERGERCSESSWSRHVLPVSVGWRLRAPQYGLQLSQGCVRPRTGMRSHGCAVPAVANRDDIAGTRPDRGGCPGPTRFTIEGTVISTPRLRCSWDMSGSEPAGRQRQDRHVWRISHGPSRGGYAHTRSHGAVVAGPVAAQRPRHCCATSRRVRRWC
jgi:hypothetical protein